GPVSSARVNASTALAKSPAFRCVSPTRQLTSPAPSVTGAAMRSVTATSRGCVVWWRSRRARASLARVRLRWSLRIASSSPLAAARALPRGLAPPRYNRLADHLDPTQEDSAMKLGLLADIHEEVERLRQAVVTLRAAGAERLIVLGDVFENGRRIEETVALLRE